MVELNQSLLAELGGWPALKEARVLVERGKVLEVTARRRGDSRAGAGRGESARAADHAGRPRGERRSALYLRRIAPLRAAFARTRSRRGWRCWVGIGDRRMMGAPSTAVEKPSGAARLPRFLLDDAPAESPRLELTVLLPLQLKDALAKDPVRVILEARRDDDAQPQPFDAILPPVSSGFAVSEEDERLLAALERLTGTIAGINAIPRAKMGAFLHVLDSHPRVWIGKKQRIDVRATAERPQITLRTRNDGSLEIGSRRTPGGDSAGETVLRIGSLMAHSSSNPVPFPPDFLLPGRS